MPFPFNRYARGLLGLLDAKVQGHLPTKLGDELQLGLDALEFYCAQVAETIADATTVINAEGFFQGNGVSLVVPQREIWLLRKYSGSFPAILGAGEIVGLWPAFRRISSVGTNCDFILTDSQGDADFTNGRIPAFGFQGPCVLLPGDNLGTYVYTHLTAAQSCSLFAEIVRLPI